MVNKDVINNRSIIRQGELKDAERIAILAEQLGYPVTSQQVKQRLAKIKTNDAHALYVATSENEYIVGWIHACIYNSIVMQSPVIILGLVVDRDRQRGGIGRLLTEQIEN